MDIKSKHEWIYFDRKTNAITRVITWITSFLNNEQLYELIDQLLHMLQTRKRFPSPKNPDCQHPNYRDFFVDGKKPLPIEEIETAIEPTLDYKAIIQEHILKYNVVILPVKNRKPETSVDENVKCPRCNAPAEYLYFNDGKKRSQCRCKICDNLFFLINRDKKKGQISLSVL